MSSPPPQATRRGLSVPAGLALGAITIGILDLADALVFFGLRGVDPIRIPQSIAAGILGPAAFQGGAGTAALGVALHFFIAFCIAGTYLAASARLPILVHRAVACGLAYGLAVYVVMNAVVVPVSAAGSGPKPLPVLVNGILIHLLGVGLPAALAARAVRRG